MTNIVSVTRILNEDDILEAFVRHNAAHVRHMVFLDNGSTDATLGILRSLRAEGIALSVFQSRSLSFDEVATNTWAYQLASQIHQAAWVIFLDADEFIDAARPLAALLPGGDAAQLSLLHYGQTGAENPDEPVVPLRMRWRLAAPTNVYKLLIRGGLGGRVSIEAGNHGAHLAGRKLAAPVLEEVVLAHYPRRHGYQNLQKILVGRLKVLAAGKAATQAGRSAHYVSPSETLRDKPWELVGNAAYLDREFALAEAVEAPLEYLGGPLRYWQPAEPGFKALQLAIRYAEALAAQHGRLLDESAQARALVEGWNARREFLF